MDLATIAVVGAVFLVFALASARLEGTVLTAPLIFVAFGFLAGAGGMGFANIDVEHSAIHVIAELTLILVLFTDAARIDLKRVRVSAGRDSTGPNRGCNCGHGGSAWPA